MISVEKKWEVCDGVVGMSSDIRLENLFNNLVHRFSYLDTGKDDSYLTGYNILNSIMLSRMPQTSL